MYNYKAQVIRWVDGDTVWLRVDLGFRMTTENDFRLWGVDTPERGRPGYKEARMRCEQLAPVGSTVEINVYKVPDKYGRWLVDIVLPGAVPGEQHVGIMLVNEGYGIPYYGGPRPSERVAWDGRS